MQAVEPHFFISRIRALLNSASMINALKDKPREQEAFIDVYIKDLEGLLQLCERTGMDMSRIQAIRAVEFMKQFRNTTKTCDRQTNGLAMTLEDEMSLRMYFCLSPEKTKYFSQTTAFGQPVGDNFPSTNYDILEANRCFALARNTACVFHLMRVLEIGLGVLARRFSVPSDHTNWHNIIEGVEKAIRGISSDPGKPADWKEQQEFFSQAASHFMFMKEAWRNYTAHARGKYTDEEAETILINVRGFMQKLATRLHE